MSKNLGEVLALSEPFHQDLDDIWQDAPLPTDKRAMVATSYCAIVREHVLSQQYLLAVGHDITAMTLVRPAFEALVRAVWVFKGAKHSWVEAFLSPHAAGLDAGNETIKGTDVDAMLQTIERNHPAHVFGSLKTLKDATWIPMHS